MIEIAYFIDVIKSNNKKIVYFDPYEELPPELLKKWSLEGRPKNWRKQLKMIANP